MRGQRSKKSVSDDSELDETADSPADSASTDSEHEVRVSTFGAGPAADVWFHATFCDHDRRTRR